jgi:hypothetical protein
MRAPRGAVKMVEDSEGGFSPVTPIAAAYPARAFVSASSLAFIVSVPAA